MDYEHISSLPVVESDDKIIRMIIFRDHQREKRSVCSGLSGWADGRREGGLKGGWAARGAGGSGVPGGPGQV